ncbi:MAG: putative metal-binding motif-containing protein [Candidatus Parcubacteria bacterium]|nr:putative metal-binding motif-containing protein [Candidatus Parcubacteria bacterium]
MASNQQCATTCADTDADGYNTCAGPNFDCNDSDATVYPGAPEIMCDTVDQNCNGNADNDIDADGDSFSYCNGDCNDANAAINPNAKEIICNDVDENCDNDLGPETTTLYSIDELDGCMYEYRGGFSSTFSTAISPWTEGFFTFDVSEIDLANVQNATVNAYVLTQGNLCDPGFNFYPQGARLNILPDEYYNVFEDCSCGYDGVEWHCTDISCQFLHEDLYQEIRPQYFAALHNQIVTMDDWWTDTFNLTEAMIPYGKRYISIFPNLGICVPDDPARPYHYSHMYEMEDGGNGAGTGNLPYMEITCQP